MRKITLSKFAFPLLVTLLLSSIVYSQNPIDPNHPSYDSLKASGYFPMTEQIDYNGPYPEIKSPENQGKGLLIPRDETFTLALDHNDDGSTASISLPFTFEFYSDDQTSFYINNNGNVSFGGAVSAYSSTGFPVNNYPMLAPFWGDVDTRPSASGLVYYKIETHRITVVWDGVGYYGNQIDKLNTFEVIFSDGLDTLIGIGNN
ncbi:MAG: hypothetical protein DRJ05_15650, partial [Bacteroidetes bacterium]